MNQLVIQVKEFVVRARLDKSYSAHLLLLEVFLGIKTITVVIIPTSLLARYLRVDRYSAIVN